MPRASVIRGVVACALLAALFYLRIHLFVLAEVASTYVAYPLQKHASLQYDPPHGPPPVHATSGQLSPTIFHHIYLNELCHDCPPSPRYLANIDSCRQLHPDWEFKLWTSDNATSFVRDNYPQVSDAYSSYAQTIQRANILRYLLLDTFGGVYLDLDLQCRASLDPLRPLSWLTPPAHPVGINNAFILAQPAHPFLRDSLIPNIVRHNLHWPLPYVENMLSTGCMFISAMVMRFERPDMRVLAGAHHMLRGAVVTPLFAHGGDSSWHRWDAVVFLMIGRLFSTVVMAGLAFTCLVVVCYVRASMRRKDLATMKRLDLV